MGLLRMMPITGGKRRRKPAGPTEHELQTECVRWFRETHPEEIIFAIPNGGYRAWKTARWMKEEGQLRGVPDLLIPARRGIYGGLFVEMKRRGAKPTAAQTDMMMRLIAKGYKCEVCATEEEFRKTVTQYMEDGMNV